MISVTIDAPFDSDQHPKAILLQGDDIAASYCGHCHTPAEDWRYCRQRHPGARPGVMFQAELFCSDCRTWAFDEQTGVRVNSYTGEPDYTPNEASHARMHTFLQNQANERGQRSVNCLGCGQRYEPDDFRVDGEGPMTSLFRVVPLTRAAKEWVAKNVSEEGFQPDWPTLYVERRFLDDLIEGIEGAGMTVAARTIQPVGAV